MKTPRFLTKRFAAAALLAVLATAALAQGTGGQGGPGGPGGPGGRMGGRPPIDRLPSLGQLVFRPEVGEELALTDAQWEKIDAIAQASRPPRPDQGGERGGPPDRAERDRAEAAADAKIRAVLTPAQAKRLGEIQIQTMGLTAAMVPAVQTRLGLTEDQKARLKVLVPPPGRGGPGGEGGPPRDGFGGPGGGPGGFGGPGGPGGQGGPPGGFGGQGGPPPGGPGGRGGRGGMDPRRQELESKIAAILTDNQKSLLKSLGGKPLQMDQNRRPPDG